MHFIKNNIVSYVLSWKDCVLLVILLFELLQIGLGSHPRKEGGGGGGGGVLKKVLYRDALP